MLNLISELNEEDLAAESDAEDYTASTDSNLSSCSESAGKINQMHNIITPRVLRESSFVSVDVVIAYLHIYWSLFFGTAAGAQFCSE